MKKINFTLFFVFIMIMKPITGSSHIQQSDRKMIRSHEKTAQEKLSTELTAALSRSNLSRINDYTHQNSIDWSKGKNNDSSSMAKIKARQLAARLEQQNAKVRQDSLDRIVKAKADSLIRANSLKKEKILAQLRDERIEYLSEQSKKQQMKLENERSKVLKHRKWILILSILLFISITFSITIMIKYRNLKNNK